MNVYSRKLLKPIILPACAPRDLWSAIDATCSTGIPCPAPKSISLSTLKVLKVRPCTFHLSGLFPVGIKTVYLICPSVFSSTGWCRRKPAPREIFRIFDVPESQHDHLPFNAAELLSMTRSFVPLKCIHRWGKACLHSPLDTVLTPDSAKVGTVTNVSVTRTITLPDCPVPSMATSSKMQSVKHDDASIPIDLWKSRASRGNANTLPLHLENLWTWA